MDADGRGWKPIHLPNDGYIPARRRTSFENAVSPDGKWLAYFTGSMAEPYDLALHLLDLEDETTSRITRLIAPGFPENLEPVRTSDPAELEGCTEGACRTNLIESAFREGIESIAWSPDSQSLAFAAQIHGPSSDVYVFSLEDKRVRKLVDDLENVWQIDWSPNGERILYQNSTAGLRYMTAYIYVADPGQKLVQSPDVIADGKFGYEYGWIAENLYLVAHGGEGTPPQNFRYINIETQQIIDLWPYTAQSYAIEPGGETLVVSTIPGGYFNNAPDEGTYIVPLIGNYSKIADDRFVLYDGFRESQVFGRQKDQIYSILLDGSIILVGPSEWNESQQPIMASPNQEWIFLLENENRITLYTAETYEPKKSWDFNETIYRISWRPDSLGAFLLTDRYIYYLSVPDGEPVRLQDCSPNIRCPNRDFLWRP